MNNTVLKQEADELFCCCDLCKKSVKAVTLYKTAPVPKDNNNEVVKKSRIRKIMKLFNADIDYPEICPDCLKKETFRNI